MPTGILILLTSLLLCCSESNTLPEQRQITPINRQSEETFFTIIPPPIQSPLPFPWLIKWDSALPPITKEHFRCKGCTSNPWKEYINHRGEKLALLDCEGGQLHSLPLFDSKEGVYPLLIDLLNYLQEQSSHQVVVTSGHRCPIHNRYVDPSSYNSTSKHQLGAEVDFYLEGLEQQPEKAVELIMAYYSHLSEYGAFERYTKSDTNVRTQPWYNQEIFIKLFQPDEGRNDDNNHPFPYLSVQLRYDRHSQQRVSFSWKSAESGYLRG